MGDPLLWFVEIGKYLIIGYVIAMLGRAIAARIAGPNAGLVLGASLISISIPLPHRQEVESENENAGNTDNTTTLDNTGIQPNTAENTVETAKLTDEKGVRTVTRMTAEEHAELMTVRHEAIGLLDRCVRYYRDTGKADDGTIPRFDEIKMNSEDRGLIVKNLEYSGYVSILKNKRTFVVPEFGSCALLMRLILDNKRRVYPVGYAERQKELLDSAVNALPEVKR